MKIRNLLICLLVIGFMASIATVPAIGSLRAFAKGTPVRATPPSPPSSNIESDGAGGWRVYPSGKSWLAVGKNTDKAPRALIDTNTDFGAIKAAFDAGFKVCAINDTGNFMTTTATEITAVDTINHKLTLTDDIFKKIGTSYKVGYILPRHAVWTNLMFGTEDSYMVQWAFDNVSGSLPTVLLKATLKGTSTFTPFQYPEILLGTVADGGQFQNSILKNVILKGEILSGRTFQNYHPDLDGTPLMATIEKGFMVFGINVTWLYLGAISSDATHVEIRDLVSKGVTASLIHANSPSWNNAPPVPPNDVYYTNLKIVDVLNDPFMGVVLPIYSHNRGKFEVTNCMIREKESYYTEANAPFLHGGTVYVGGDYIPMLADVKFTGNDVVMASSPFGSFGIGIDGDFTRYDNPKVSNILIQNNKAVADRAIYYNAAVATGQILDNTITGRVIGIDAMSPYPDLPLVSSASLKVKGNTINIDSTGSVVYPWLNPFTAGFVGIDYSQMVLATCPDPYNCIHLEFSSLSNTDISNNKFTGTANYAVYMGDHHLGISPPNDGTGNTFWGNNISGLTLIPWNVYDDFGNVLFTVLPNTYYFSSTTSNNTVGGNSGGEGYAYSGSTSNNITGPGLPRNGGIAIGQNKIPPIPKHKLTPAQQAAVDKFKNAKHRL